MLILLFCLVFKVIAIEESGFVEKTNLRVGRINLNFSITDVQWHPVDGKYLFVINNKNNNNNKSNIFCYHMTGLGVPCDKPKLRNIPCDYSFCT